MQWCAVSWLPHQQDISPYFTNVQLRHAVLRVWNWSKWKRDYQPMRLDSHWIHSASLHTSTVLVGLKLACELCTIPPLHRKGPTFGPLGLSALGTASFPDFKTLRCFKIWAKRFGLNRVLHHCSKSKFSHILCTQKHQQGQIHVSWTCKPCLFNKLCLSIRNYSKIRQSCDLYWDPLPPAFGTHSSTLVSPKSKVLVPNWLGLTRLCSIKLQHQVPFNIEFSHPDIPHISIYDKPINNPTSFKVQNYIGRFIYQCSPIISSYGQESPHIRLCPPLPILSPDILLNYVL